MENISELKADNLILAKQLSHLCGYVSTCKDTNTMDWMVGRVTKINSSLAVLGDDDRVRLIHAGDEWVIINREDA